ncbi:hypothetical protein BCR33DRAFT_717207 [Rhizoclosmatium globosum]|uniref:SAM domain-containing protein n=1 Tax=Rhizoclosmatium globosum TaxID=329046 RepID=A0A1Y2CAQ9_9FUNG|nr:hypothetical protein BCR33DRAFT_717207 [Rhizoclosmatium globosum]|eukprot:ORY44121.1 hypothetical protein BCR33DRAFT_717207 [Rhizoclosmatium globosum]
MSGYASLHNVGYIKGMIPFHDLDPYPFIDKERDLYTCPYAPGLDTSDTNNGNRNCIFYNQTLAGTWCLSDPKCRVMECHLYIPQNQTYCWLGSLPLVSGSFNRAATTNQKGYTVGFSSVDSPVLSSAYFTGDTFNNWTAAASNCLEVGRCFGFVCQSDNTTCTTTDQVFTGTVTVPLDTKWISTTSTQSNLWAGPPAVSTDFVPPPVTRPGNIKQVNNEPSVPIPSSAPDTPSNGGTNAGAVVGGVVGLIAVGAIVAGLVYVRRRSSQTSEGPIQDAPKADDSNSSGQPAPDSKDILYDLTLSPPLTPKAVDAPATDNIEITVFTSSQEAEPLPPKPTLFSGLNNLRHGSLDPLQADSSTPARSRKGSIFQEMQATIVNNIKQQSMPRERPQNPQNWSTKAVAAWILSNVALEEDIDGRALMRIRSQDIVTVLKIEKTGERLRIEEAHEKLCGEQDANPPSYTPYF